MEHEQITIYDLINDLKEIKEAEISISEKADIIQNKLIEISKNNQGFYLPDPKDYIIFRIGYNNKIEYFAEYGIGYTSSLAEAGEFNTTGIEYYNAYIVNSYEEALNDKQHDYYCLKIERLKMV